MTRDAAPAAPRLADLDLPALAAIRAVLAQAPRMHGYYLTRLIAADLVAGVDDATRLDRLFEQLDDRPWPPPSERRADPAADYQVDAATAGAHAVSILIGGADVGHTRDTIAPATAAALWTQFRALFAPTARCFIGLGLGDPAYVLQRGVAVVDDTRAGYLGVIESD